MPTDANSTAPSAKADSFRTSWETPRSRWFSYAHQKLSAWAPTSKSWPLKAKTRLRFGREESWPQLSIRNFPMTHAFTKPSLTYVGGTLLSVDLWLWILPATLIASRTQIFQNFSPELFS